HVTVEGEPVSVRPDGTFAVRMHFPDRRQVVPVVASAADGVEQKTIILGIERNTKELEPMVRGANHLEPSPAVIAKLLLQLASRSKPFPTEAFFVCSSATMRKCRV